MSLSSNQQPDGAQSSPLPTRSHITTACASDPVIQSIHELVKWEGLPEYCDLLDHMKDQYLMEVECSQDQTQTVILGVRHLRGFFKKLHQEIRVAEMRSKKV